MSQSWSWPVAGLSQSLGSFGTVASLLVHWLGPYKEGCGLWWTWDQWLVGGGGAQEILELVPAHQ